MTKDLPIAAKVREGPRWAEVDAPVAHVASTMEAPPRLGPSKKPARKPARPVEPPTDVEPLALTLADCRLDSDDPIARLVAFMSERYAIFKRRKAGEKWPWTTDPILRDAKFCNVFRESDRTSIWIAQNWRDPRRDDPDNWLPMALARFGPFETSALEAIGYPVSWNPGHVRAVLTERLQRKQPTFSSAYKGIMAEPGQSRVDSVIQVLDQMWCDREQLRPRPRRHLPILL